MLNRIIRFSIKNKLVIGLLVLLLGIWGVYSLAHLPIDAVPDITNNQVQVITVSPANGAEDIERFVTFPVEQTMATIPGIEEIRSFSRFGLSVVTIVFEEKVDVYWARQQVNERLTRVSNDLPAGMGSPELAPVTTGLGEIFQYIVHTKKGYENKYTPMELRTIQDWIVRRQMLGVEGVADVASFGGYLKQYEIALNPEKLRSMNLSIADVFEALEKNNQNTGGAYIDKKPHAWFVRSVGLVKSLEDIERIVVANTSNQIPVLIRDIGTVQYGSAIRYGAMTSNREGEVTGAVVMMLKGANSSAVIRRVKERMALIEKTLPEGVTIEPFLDRTKLVDAAIGTVSRNLLEGALIVILVLVLLLGNLRGGLIVASVIPLAMLFAVAMMNLFGVSGNLMSLGAIDFGLIVDGAVIIVEATMHQLGISKLKKLNQEQMDEQVYTSSRKMMNAAAFGQIIILIVYLPLLSLVGIEGKMFRPMAQTVSFAILGALLLSITYVPMMSALCLNKTISHKKTVADRIMGFLERIYKPVLQAAWHRKGITVGLSLLLLLGSVLLFSRLGAEFIPSLDEGDFAVETRVLTGSSLSKTVDAANQAADVLLKQFPEVKKVVGKIGSSEIPTDPMPVELCDLIVVLKPKEEWTSARTRDELAEKMQAALEKHIPGVTFGFQQPIQMRFNELMSGARQDVVVKIFGEDLEVLSGYAKKIGRIATATNGATDVYVEEVSGLPQILVNFKRDKIAQYGLNIAAINQVIRAGFAGDVAGEVFEGEKRFDLVVRLDKQSRQGIDDLRGLYITAPNGNQVPLEQLADVELKIGPNQVQREDAKRRITIGFNVRGRDVASIVKEIQERVGKEVKFEAGYYVTYGGTFENLEQAKKRLSIAVPVALLLILILLYFTFRSFKYGLLIFSAIPLSAIGGVLALWLRGMPFSISAGVGFIALFGVAVLNGIVMIAEFNRLKKDGMTNLQELVMQGTLTRLRPVIMTATVASLGFLPMALSNGSGAEVQRPLATVVIGGLISATFLTLVVLPCLYGWLEGKIRRPSGGLSAVVLLLLLSVTALPVKAQEAGLSLEQAIERAIKNNPAVQVSRLGVEKERALKGTAADWAKTNVSLQYGQANSIKWDNHLGISQQLPNPSLVRQQRVLADARIKGSELELGITQHELAYAVKVNWYQLEYLNALKQQLQQQDSVYSSFLRAAELRYKTGETKLLEQTTAATALAEHRNSMRGNEADISIVLAELQRLINDSAAVQVTFKSISKLEPTLSAQDSLDNNPLLKAGKQQVAISSQSVQVEKAKRHPDFSIGYFNQSIIGYQNVDGTEKYYGGSQRFQGVQAGVSIPLFGKSWASRINAARLESQQAENNVQLVQHNLQAQYRQALQEYEKNRRSVEYYEATALPNARLMIQQGLRSFRSGEVGYVEYLQAIKTGNELQVNYLSQLHQYNQSVIRLQWLLGNR
ncbi:CusA/CzcA family heavy metal efflux RND transporter [Paraflavitalea sp. CAU 1676]|uniref:CusA/CzcA family heavy metal efflux RND transporter n=1 Tax=Paraflavitalea sp. CAU 1676 TaxID=3032598 RepID=UPI0023DAF779|nr:CusA/CzcA family heavy metal efflux RND transporter [Paraflavitalea sp. CAU 1676]MDF2192923.1 CusA/CzcA family heavy metal efflux RND transporter [Paraflavitalea sp. CAU 1676]